MLPSLPAYPSSQGHGEPQRLFSMDPLLLDQCSEVHAVLLRNDANAETRRTHFRESADSYLFRCKLRDFIRLVDASQLQGIARGPENHDRYDDAYGHGLARDDGFRRCTAHV
ncbi:unnamed protein product [Amoebophrya sp. A25]|nr:unnamed protein product [Amoebophrya sp. A25]|eukprot:GSA25T00000479001.1